MRGHNDTNWVEDHQQWIAIRKERLQYVLISEPIKGHPEHMSH